MTAYAEFLAEKVNFDTRMGFDVDPDEIQDAVVSASRRKGTAFETLVAGFLTDALERPVHRLAQHGTKDIGDIAIEGISVTIEAKAGRSIELGQWMTETDIEAKRRGTRWAALVIKRRMKPVSQSYVVMDLAQWVDLIKAGAASDLKGH